MALTNPCTGQQLINEINNKINDSEGVHKSGDIMTGDLGLEKDSANLKLFFNHLEDSTGKDTRGSSQNCIESKRNDAIYIRALKEIDDTKNQNYIAVCSPDSVSDDIAPYYVRLLNNERVGGLDKIYHEGFAPVVSGTYTCDSGTDIKTIYLGFKPKWVFVSHKSVAAHVVSYALVTAVESSGSVRITDTGFQVYDEFCRKCNYIVGR